jgi:hypothetical protein
MPLLGVSDLDAGVPGVSDSVELSTVFLGSSQFLRAESGASRKYQFVRWCLGRFQSVNPKHAASQFLRVTHGAFRGLDQPGW